MPGISPINILGNVKFFGASLKMPVQQGDKGFKHPQGDPDGQQYNDAFKKPDDLIAIPQLIPPWFMPLEQNKYYQDQCDKIGGFFKDTHDAMLQGVQLAHAMWKLQAKFQNLMIMGPVAQGQPGCLDGPALESNIKNLAPPPSWSQGWSGNAGKFRDAIAKGVSDCFKDWQDQVQVPGLPWYPAFAAFAGPMAPPMPNIPMPLISCPSGMMSKIVAPNDMKQAMIDALDSDLKQKDPEKHHEALFDAIATVLSMAFLTWLPSQQIMLVLGQGPIPTFAPPFVPVGPVMNGNNISAPGHLMA